MLNALQQNSTRNMKNAINTTKLWKFVPLIVSYTWNKTTSTAVQHASAVVVFTIYFLLWFLLLFFVILNHISRYCTCCSLVLAHITPHKSLYSTGWFRNITLTFFAYKVVWSFIYHFSLKTCFNRFSSCKDSFIFRQFFLIQFI